MFLRWSFTPDSEVRAAVEFTVRLGLQCPLQGAQHRPVELEHVVLEVDALEEDTKSALVSHLFDDGVGDQAIRRVHGEGDVSLERYGTSQPLGNTLAQRGGV